VRADPRLKVEDVRFAILVDDLDRSVPETTLAVLENIRQFLAVRRSIFMLALNAHIVSEVFPAKHGVPPDDGRAYLERILDFTFSVPEPAPERVRPFARERRETLLEDSDPAQRPALQRGFDDFGQVLENCRVSNPRKIKRILNRYLLFLDGLVEQLERCCLPNFVRLLTLAEYEPALLEAFLPDSEKTRLELMKVGTPEFSIPAFEAAYGVHMRVTFPQLSAMRQLFQLEQQPDLSKLSVQQQVNEVYVLTRWR
jgi:KAP family P-loop domain